jgi:hypothetical protein
MGIDQLLWRTSDFFESAMKPRAAFTPRGGCLSLTFFYHLHPVGDRGDFWETVHHAVRRILFGAVLSIFVEEVIFLCDGDGTPTSLKK